MKASTDDQKRLVELGRIDTDLVRISRQLSSLPAAEEVAAAEKSLLSARENRRACQEEVDGLTSDLSKAETDVELVKKRLDHDQALLAGSTSAKDAQGLEHEIGTLHTRLQMLEDVQLEVMEKLETASEALRAASEQVGAVEQALAVGHTQLESETAALEGARQALNDERAQVVAHLPDDLVALYDTQRERYGVGVSQLVNGVSSASGVQLTESDLQDIRQAAPEDVLLCPDSNAILVRAS